MLDSLQTLRKSLKYWYFSLIIGILLVAFGIYLTFFPVKTFLAIAVVFSFSFLFYGILDIIFSVQNRCVLKGWVWYFINGLISLFLGSIMIASPNLSEALLPFYVAFMLMFKSAIYLGHSYELKKLHIKLWKQVCVWSIIGLVCSMILLAWPLFTSLTIVYMVAFTFVFVGISAISIAFSLKKIKDLPNNIAEEKLHKLEELKEQMDNITNTL